MDKQIKALLKEYHPNQPEFHQAVEEIYKDIADFYHDHQTYRDFKILEQLLEPDRVIRFRVCWENDKHEICVNRGWRVQYHNILGPYKGGLRFTPNLNESVLKFLGFEQCFKNALTNFPIGGGKGGADFNPKGKSNHEIRRFCWAFIEELRKYIDRDVDIPAGDIGVGAREIGYMFGHILELDNKYTGVLTGKGIQFGGSCGREHATGYGCIYFLKEMLKAHDHEFKHKK
ncbi:glutamate dehydrogenase/leucine dehydrogenase [Legionella oakridgensis ATCC 33761 = DSM 21215]|uniref:Glutamate dehydrogenase/leucine dehydrogenase n=2 Tax=Legionella oakridgensis TaxID=29423 RepID=W0BHQ7_9GAMM|nr:Glu/Leu/Phe/Val dehydrogenase dimerization domain-containing protein [Legionella oakridgensis]AHE67939.1 glutamate dehydrogenase/leucine dehydrogenase [Legionella oakridgensis ATCC 33761 = DSM 21215]